VFNKKSLSKIFLVEGIVGGSLLGIYLPKYILFFRFIGRGKKRFFAELI